METGSHAGLLRRSFDLARFLGACRAVAVSVASAPSSRARSRGAAKSSSARSFKGKRPWPKYKKLTGRGAGSKGCNNNSSWRARTADSTWYDSTHDTPAPAIDASMAASAVLTTSRE